MAEITISKLVNSGMGLGKDSDNITVFIPQTLPEEKVTYTVTTNKKSYRIGKLKKVLAPSQHRIDPPCCFYATCGGCSFMHCDYPAQLYYKQQILTDLFMREEKGLLKKYHQLIKPVVSSPEETHYRQRIRLQVKDERPGFRQHKSHSLVEIDTCLIARPLLNETLHFLKKNEHASHLFSIIEELELLENPGSRTTLLILHVKRKPRPTDHKHALAIIADISCVENVLFKGSDFAPITAGKTTQKIPTLTIPLQNELLKEKELALQFEAGGFCQVNLSQNSRMINHVIHFAGDNDTVLDLYCGMGNFTIPLAHNCNHITGIEGQGSSIRSAKKNGAANKLTNTRFIKEPIDKACKRLLEEKQQFDMTVLDPPRQGAAGLCSMITRLTNKKIIYISCDPATLCRDLANFIHNGFHPVSIQPFDMFPQTHHIETVVLLEKN